MTADELFAQVVRAAREDPNILGLYVGGSRAKGAATALSDWDAELIVADEVAADYRVRWRIKEAGFDLTVFSLTEFRAHAAIGSATEWDRYGFTHLRATVDKLDGEIQRLIDDKGSLPPEVARQRLPGTVDAYINFVYRSLKNARDGRPLAARLDAAESVPFLLHLVFMAHGRLRPYNKYLAWELEHWPLAELPWTSGEFLDLVAAIAAGDLAAQRTVFAGVKALACAHGQAAVFESWDPQSLAVMD